MYTYCVDCNSLLQKQGPYRKLCAVCVGKRISKTKCTVLGRIVSKRARLKCKDRVISKLKGKQPWNKLTAEEKITVICQQCQKMSLVVPCKKEKSSVVHTAA